MRHDVVALSYDADIRRSVSVFLGYVAKALAFGVATAPSILPWGGHITRSF